MVNCILINGELYALISTDYYNYLRENCPFYNSSHEKADFADSVLNLGLYRGINHFIACAATAQLRVTL